MKTLIRVFVFFLIPFWASAQSQIFYSNLNNQYNSVLTSYTNHIYSDTINSFSIGPRFFGISSGSNNKISNTYLLGLRFDANIRNKLFIVACYDYLDADDNLQIKNYQDSLDIYYPGFGLDNKRGQFNVKYLANKFITIDIGHGKQFIGDGYQSLLLSDVSFSYPYLKLTTEFGPVRYYNLYTTFINPSMVDYGRKKHATIHYLDFAITNKIHVGVFESILWQSKSEEVYRGYELAYLNPIIFYRPVEFSKKSDKGNALMGASINMTFIKNSILYAQFILDDLNVSRQEDSDGNYQEGFFQNKYGYQLGLRGRIKGVKYLIEYNKVQPYTYGHRTILQNYSHMNQALAHPLGANFKEFVNILEIKKGRWTYKTKTMFTRVGLDSLNTHYGQNIFESDNSSVTGALSYGNFNGQGINTTIFSFQPEVSFKLKNFDVFASVYYRIKKSDLLDQTLIFYSLGLRTFPFSNFQDY